VITSGEGQGSRQIGMREFLLLEDLDMEPTWSGAEQIIFEGPTGGSYTSGPFRGVLHTTQSREYNPSTTEYYGHRNPPHFTLAMKTGGARVYQHYSIRVAARALKNPPGGVQTNRQSAIQIEIAWRAERIRFLPDSMYETLAELMRWIEEQTGIQKEAPLFLDSNAYGNGSAARMGAEEWEAFNGWCGHQHVPENDHWDPGMIDIARLFGQQLYAAA